MLEEINYIDGDETMVLPAVLGDGAGSDTERAARQDAKGN